MTDYDDSPRAAKRTPNAQPQRETYPGKGGAAQGIGGRIYDDFTRSRSAKDRWLRRICCTPIGGSVGIILAVTYEQRCPVRVDAVEKRF
jgi:hypothetical protein